MKTIETALRKRIEVLEGALGPVALMRDEKLAGRWEYDTASDDKDFQISLNKYELEQIAVAMQPKERTP